LHLEEIAERPVQRSDLLALDILSGGGFHNMLADPAVHARHKPIFHRPHKATRCLKNWNRKVYYGLKFSVMTALAGLIVLSVLS
jgi:hypothetical protein